MESYPLVVMAEHRQKQSLRSATGLILALGNKLTREYARALAVGQSLFEFTALRHAASSNPPHCRKATLFACECERRLKSQARE